MDVEQCAKLVVRTSAASNVATARGLRWFDSDLSERDDEEEFFPRQHDPLPAGRDSEDWTSDFPDRISAISKFDR